MSFESFSRLSQSIKDAAKQADTESARKAAALAVNAVGAMSTPKRGERPTAFDAAVNTVADAIAKVRASKQTEAKKTEKTEQPEAQKSLAELLRAAAGEA